MVDGHVHDSHTHSYSMNAAMIYKAFEYAADTAEIENVLKFDQVTPILASAATGVFYKSTGALICSSE